MGRPEAFPPDQHKSGLILAVILAALIGG